MTRRIHRIDWRERNPSGIHRQRTEYADTEAQAETIAALNLHRAIGGIVCIYPITSHEETTR